MADLTEIRRRVAAIPDPVRALEALFAASPVAFQIYGTDGRSVLTNAAFRALFGVAPAPDYNVLHDEGLEHNGLRPLIRRAFAGEIVETPAVWYGPSRSVEGEAAGRRVAVAATFSPLFAVDGTTVTHVSVIFQDHTNEFRSREAAEEERDLLRAIIEQSGNGIIVCDDQGVTRIFNPEAVRQHGHGKAEVPPSEWTREWGLHDLQHSPLPKDRIPLYRALNGETVKDAHWIVHRPDGSFRLLAGTATPLVRSDGSSAGAVLISRDETDRMGEELQKRAQAAVNTALSKSAPLPETLQDVVSGLCGATGFELGAVWLVDPDDGYIRCHALTDKTPERLDAFAEATRASVFRRGEGLPGRVWESGAPSWFDGARAMAPLPRWGAAEKAGFQRGLGFPIRGAGHGLGVVELFTRHPLPRDDDLLRLATLLGDQIGQFILRARAQEALRENEERTQAKLEAALDCIISMDAAGRVLSFNAAAEKTFGYSRDAVTGRDMAELIIPPRLRDRHREGLHRYLSTGEGPILGKRIEMTAMDVHGREFPVELTVSRIPSRGSPTFIGFVRDITRRQQLEAEREWLLERERTTRAATEESLALLDAFIDNTPVGVAFLDREYRYVRVNQALTTATGRAAAEHSGQTLQEATPAMAAVMEPLLTRALSGETLGNEELSFPVGTQPTTVRHWLVNLFPVRTPDGRTLGVGATLNDMTERMKIQDEKARLYQEAREAVRARDEFLSVASHDLRSPLTSLGLQVQMILRRLRTSGQLPTDWALPRLETMQRQIERISEMLSDLLDVSRIQAGRLTLRLEKVDLTEVALEVAGRFEELMKSAGSTWSVQAPLPVVGDWDRLRLEQVLSNLLGNAVKFGSGRPIEIGVEGDAHAARLIVRDHGVGIAPEHHAAIFQRFERAGNKSAFEGTGLGLWIVKRIVDALGGAVEVQSRPGQGATFIVALPRQAAIAP